MKNDIDYKFDEITILKELKDYIDKSYSSHYQGIQPNEIIIDKGHGAGFCIGNIIKYSSRYGKKEGKNRADLLKVAHYAILLLHVDDRERFEEKMNNGETQNENQQ